jgi:hypothetical protein
MSEGATHLSVWSRNILALLSRNRTSGMGREKPGLHHRDRNPSLTIARLCGLENHERPAVFQRRGHSPVNNVPPG